MKRLSPLLIALWFAASCAVRAEVTLAPLFTDHAVLQRDQPVPVWGRAAPGEKVRVEFRGQTAAATAGADGRWIVYLEKLAASAQGADLTVTGTNALVVRDVLVGEVWLCSGQSNMEMTVEARPGTWQANTRVINAAAEVAAANLPLIRHVRIAQTVAAAPADTVQTSGWEAASPQTAGGFTAVGYFFAREIFQKLGVPVGLVHSSWGGTPVESWLSPAALASRPEFGVVRERWQQNVAAYPANRAAYEQAFAAWTKAEAAVTAEAAGATKAAKGKKAPAGDARAAWLKKNPRPRAPRGPGDPWTPTALFNGMINPLLPYALRGALWYQGESNAERAAEYHALFAAMITAWRAHFGQGDFPFYWANLANFTVGADASGASWAALREAQTKTLALPNTGQALAIDIGDPKDIHPANKQEVGRRLALLAKNRVYGVMGDDTGPTFASATRESLPAGAGAARSTDSGQALRVRFTHATGLIARDKPVQSLEVAGADRKFFPATARIERDTLLVSSPQVKEPVAVRYAWKNAPEANLYNSAGLPAVPFRSDAW
ncbi:MAG: sialate O-acetylesterase [Verrucomicrobia bacterium]|nr:sialate O-acetylesterase [Verrucomicrobiota bacterium]